jgi:hypothetical protein
MQSDFADIRFSAGMGGSCPYYIDTKTDGSTAEVWVNVAPALQYYVYLYYGNNVATSESSLAAVFPVTNQFAGSGINSDVENGGIERKPFFEKFDVDDLAAYTVTGAPTIASGVLTLASLDIIYRTLPGSDPAGKWDIVFKFTTPRTSGNQQVALYFQGFEDGTLGILRGAGNAISILTSFFDGPGTGVIDTGETLADDVYGCASIVYDGTNYQMYWNDVAVGDPLTGPAYAVPSIGVFAFNSTVVVDEMNHIPSVAYQDLYGSDTESRYMQLSSTDLSTWASSAAGDVVVSGGYMTLSSDDDRGIYAVRKAYNHASGEIEFSFTNANDGGGGADVCGMVFCYQDILNHYKIVVEDDGAGAENLKLYKVIAGTATQIGSTKDVSATYTRGNTTRIKLHYSREYGQVWAYLRDDAGTYPTSPDIADAFVSSWPYGEVGVFATVTTAGAGNLSVAFDDLTVRAGLLVGESNVFTTESGFYWRDEFTVSDSDRWLVQTAGDTAFWSWDAGVLKSTATTQRGLTYPQKINNDNLAITFDYIPQTQDATRFILGFLLQGIYRAPGVSTGSQGYAVYFRDNSVRILEDLVTATTAVYTFTAGSTYKIKISMSSAGVINIYVDTTSDYGTTLITTYTDTTYTFGYVGFDSVVNVTFIDNLTINGTRYYNEPMPYGAQIGEYWNGTSTVTATRLCDNFNYDTIAEYTQVYRTWSVDTAKGDLDVSGTNALLRTNNKFGSGLYICKFYASTFGLQYLVFGWDGTSDGAGLIYNGYSLRQSSTQLTLAKSDGVGTLTTLASLISYVPAVNTPYYLVVYWNQTTGDIIANIYSAAWVKLTAGITTTDTTFQSSNYAGLKSTVTTVHPMGLEINALESSMHNGASVLNGSIAHGGEWDTGITAGYLLREYADPEPTTDSDYPRTLNKPQASIIWSDGNVAESLSFSPISCSLSVPTANLTGTVDLGAINAHLFAVVGDVTVPANINTFIKSGTVSREFINKMYSANFEFDGKSTGYNYFSGLYYKHVQFIIPDYIGTDHCVFVGFFPGSQTTFAPGADSQALTAYDYGFYLSNQVLEFSDLELLTPTDQLLETKHQLYYLSGTARFNIGDRILGGTSGDSGTVIEVNGYPGGYIVMKGMAGTGPTYFQDGENLIRCGVTVAVADGFTLDVTGIIDVQFPEDWIRRALGGDDWLSKTGIEPYRIASTAAIWDVTVPACAFQFEELRTKMSCIEEICQKLKFIFYVKWRLVGGIYRPCAYFINETDIDDGAAGLDLPATVTITKPSAFLAKPVTLDQKGEERVNQVIVKCQAFDGTWYTAIVQSSGVDSGDEIPLTKKEINASITTQAEATQRANDLYNYYQYQVATWKATFIRRSDLELLQKMTFSGYGVDIPDGDYRIIGIEYHYAAVDHSIINEVTCTLMPASYFQSYLNLSRVFTGSIWEIQKIIKAELEKQTKNEVGTVTDVTAGKVTVLTETGMTKTARDGAN